MGQVNFALGQVKIEVWWASEISLSSLVSLSETVSLINGNFQWETSSNLKTASWAKQWIEIMDSDTIFVSLSSISVT